MKGLFENISTNILFMWHYHYCLCRATRSLNIVLKVYELCPSSLKQTNSSSSEKNQKKKESLRFGGWYLHCILSSYWKSSSGSTVAPGLSLLASFLSVITHVLQITYQVMNGKNMFSFICITINQNQSNIYINRKQNKRWSLWLC